MARTDALSTAKRIRRQTGGMHRLDVGVLFANIAAGDTTLLFSSTLPKSVQPGAVLGIDLELMRIITVNTGANSVTVMRGFLDSDAASHLAGAQIDIAPRFSMMDVFDQMTSEIDSWAPDLYYVDSQTLTVATTAHIVELPATWSSMLGVVECLQSDQGTSETFWPRLEGRLIRGTAASFTGAPTSGMMLRFFEPIRSGKVFVTVALPFDTALLTSSVDLVTGVKLNKAQLDVLEMGVRIRLVANSTEAATARNAQDEPRRAEETPLGTLVSITQLGVARYEQRKSQEVARLRRLYPVRYQ